MRIPSSQMKYPFHNSIVANLSTPNQNKQRGIRGLNNKYDMNQKQKKLIHLKYFVL